MKRKTLTLQQSSSTSQPLQQIDRDSRRLKNDQQVDTKFDVVGSPLFDFSISPSTSKSLSFNSRSTGESVRRHTIKSGTYHGQTSYGANSQHICVLFCYHQRRVPVLSSGTTRLALGTSPETHLQRRNSRAYRIDLGML